MSDSDFILVSPQERAADPGPGFNPREYLRLLAARWKVLAVCCVVLTAAGLARYFLTPKLYRATAQIQIEQRSSLSVGGEQNPYLEAWASVRYYPTQYRLLKSRGLAERVVVNLRLLEDPDFAPELPNDRAAGAEELALARVASRVAAGLEVDPVKGTELVNLHYVANDPEAAAMLANGIAAAFIDWGIATRSDQVRSRSVFLSGELESLERQIRAKEEELAAVSQEADIVALEPGSNLTMQRLEKLNSDLTAATRDRIEKEAQLRTLATAPRENIADIESAGLVSKMKAGLVDRERDYETRLQTYTEEWPAMVELRTEIAERRRAIATEVDKYFEEARRRAEGEAETARQRERSLRREIDRVKQEAREMSSASVEYNNLQMEIEALRKLQDELLGDKSTTDLSARLFEERDSNVRVVERALVPAGPFRPSLTQDLLAGLVAGLALGIGLILLIHFLDRTVKTAEELERQLGLPVLSVIPDVNANGSRGYSGYGYYGYGAGAKDRRRRRGEAAPAERVEIELLPMTRPRLVASEAYRSLRTALLLSSAERLQTVAVSSAEASEGKTATATNLAVVMAQLGRRVLLLDADLRKPRLHRIFKISTRAGLAHHLTGGAPLDELFVTTEQPNLFLCPSGATPPNPSELLSSDRMMEFLEGAKKRFDMVIIDTPPVLAVADAIIVGSVVDGMLLCFRANKVVREDVRACHRRLRLAGTRVLGAILNLYQPQHGGSYGRRYQHYEAYAEEPDDSISDSAA